MPSYRSAFLTLLTATVALLALTATALASQQRPYVSSFPTTSPAGLGLDQQNGDVYVVDNSNSVVRRYDATGTAKNFTAGPDSGTNTLGGSSPFVFLGPVGAVAVDSSGGPSDGNIYVLDLSPSFTGEIHVFSNDGTPLTTLTGSGTPAGAFTFGCGLDVDQSTGDLYVGDANDFSIGRVWRYSPSSGTVAEGDYSGGIAAAGPLCAVAAAQGHVYTADTFGSGQVRSYAASDFATGPPPSPSSTLIDSGVTAVAADPNGDVYVDKGDSVSVFDSSGAPLGTFGSSSDFSESLGVAVKGGGNAYVGDRAHVEIDVFGPFITLPDATTDEATAIEPTTTTLNGTVNPDGVQLSDCHFEYGTDTSYGQSVPCSPDAASIPPDSTDHAVHADLSGLTADTTYHVRLVAANGNGSVTGADQAFTTPAALVVTTEDASNVEQTTATLNGSVNPLGAGVTDCHFDYGTDTSYGQTVPCAETVGSGTSAVPVHADVTGLSGATDYHFRLQATNANGTVAGTDQTLTTKGPPLATTGLVLDPTDTTATLSGQVNPDGFPTTYFFQYATQPDFSNAQSVPASEDADAGSGTDPVPVAQAISGLQPGTTYYWRLLATNAAGSDTAVALHPFSTLSTPAAPAACGNAELRTGASANLPDCRAYELVTPANMQGISPSAVGTQGGLFQIFDNPLTSPDGSRVYFQTGGQALPGTNGNGWADAYTAERGPNGWATSLAGPTGAEAERPFPGGISPDLLYSTWAFEPVGGPNYLRSPDGRLELIGQGSLGIDPAAEARWVTANGTHIIFATGESFGQRIQLEPEAPAAGTGALYDRSPDGPTHVVSLLPGDATPPAGQEASYQGVSEDGSAVAFKFFFQPDLYVRVDNADTYRVTSAPNTFAGLSADGDKLFYAQGGDLFSFDTSTQGTTQITTGGGARFVNVSADGSHVYFVSTQQLAPNVSPGVDNLYLWDEATGQIAFIAVVDPADVPDDPGRLSLTNWVNGAAQHKGAALDPSRTTPDGSVLVFESRARLTSYDNQGHVEVYRYAAAADALSCVSCNPSGLPPVGDAHLEAVRLGADQLSPTTTTSLIPNLTDDGKLIAFQTNGALSPKDGNGAQDVYTWQQGKLALISTGQSTSGSYLYAMTPDGHDIFFTTNQVLVPQDQNGGARTIYDARVDGGFPAEVSPSPCVGDACQGEAAPPPSDLSPGSSTFTGPGNPSEPRDCSAVKSRVRIAKRHLRRADTPKAKRAARTELRKARRQLRHCRGASR